MIARPELVKRVTAGLEHSPVTLILGPRQCGKTTLARQLGQNQEGSYYDLESPRDLARLAQPQTVLEAARGLVVLDEIHQRPDLLPLLRVLADRQPVPCRFLLLGSASPDLMKKSSETLAGRVHFVDMTGFTLAETGVERQTELWVRGGFPKSFLAGDEPRSVKLREDFIQTFLLGGTRDRT
jgi:predicted AAA+ superfamily ATPase